MPLDGGEERGKKPPAFSLQKGSYLFSPAREGFEELLNGLPAALGFRKERPSPFTNPTMKKKGWEK